MARTVATRPQGTRITDDISLGVIAKTFPITTVHSVVAATNKASIRQRDVPAHVVVSYVIALALYRQASDRDVLRCLREGIQWLIDRSMPITVAGKSGLSQARRRLGGEPLRQLHDAVVGADRGSGDQGRLVSRRASGQSGGQHLGRCR